MYKLLISCYPDLIEKGLIPPIESAVVTNHYSPFTRPESADPCAYGHFIEFLIRCIAGDFDGYLYPKHVAIDENGVNIISEYVFTTIIDEDGHYYNLNTMNLSIAPDIVTSLLNKVKMALNYYEENLDDVYYLAQGIGYKARQLYVAMCSYPPKESTLDEVTSSLESLKLDSSRTNIHELITCLRTYISQRMCKSQFDIRIRFSALSVQMFRIDSICTDTVIDFKTSMYSCVTIPNYMQLLMYWCMCRVSCIPVNKIRLFNPLLGEEAEISLESCSSFSLLKYMIDNKIITPRVMDFKHNFRLHNIQYIAHHFYKHIRYKLDSNAEIIYISNFINNDTQLMDELSNIPWYQAKYKMYDKDVILPRLMYTFTDEWTPHVYEVKKKIELLIHKQIVYAQLNLYQDGNDHIGYHADKETNDGDLVIGLSLGAERRFSFWNMKEKKVEFRLESGSIIIMNSHAIKDKWKHSIIKQPAIKESRISITFRT